MKQRKIFISYRRAQADFVSGALARELRARYGEEQVFRDKEAIGGGEPWMAAIQGAIGGEGRGHCALLVLMAHGWASLRTEEGKPRLHEPDDPIRIEVAAALKAGAVVLPVLLGDAPMPAREELPEDMRALTDYNALVLRDSEWNGDVMRIVLALRRQGFVTEEGVPDGETSLESARLRLPSSVKAPVAITVTALLALIAGFGDRTQELLIGIAFMGCLPALMAYMAWKDWREQKVRGRWMVLGAAAVSGLLVAVCLLGAVFHGAAGTDAHKPVPAPTPAPDPSPTPVPVPVPTPVPTPEPAPSPKPSPKPTPAPHVAHVPVQPVKPPVVDEAKPREQPNPTPTNAANHANVAPPVALPSPAEVKKTVTQLCEGRNFIGQSICEHRTCKERADLAQDPVCVLIRAQEEHRLPGT